MTVIKVCSCCGQKYDRAGWLTLPCIGSVTSSDETGTYLTEMRNCPCGSSIATEEKL